MPKRRPTDCGFSNEDLECLGCGVKLGCIEPGHCYDIEGEAAYKASLRQLTEQRRSTSAKPIVKVYLLPAEWDEEQFQKCFNILLEGARSLWSEVKSEDDLIVLFPKDAMTKGLGTEVVIEVDVPAPLHPRNGEDAIARAFFEAVRELLPKAHVQCKVYKFETVHGFCTT